jgi:hypothetical protein
VELVILIFRHDEIAVEPASSGATLQRAAHGWRGDSRLKRLCNVARMIRGCFVLVAALGVSACWKSTTLATTIASEPSLRCIDCEEPVAVGMPIR